MNAEGLIGTVLGTCTLQQLIGQGGMGAVFLAQQSRPRRQVAVKVLLPMTPLNSNQLAAFLERFRRETDAAASLEHPNIMPVHEYGERNGLAYLVMPYISGGTLRDEMEREGPLPLDKVVNYLEQVGAALDFAHEHGVIHRDVKPANLLMTPEGRLLLTDFGLVKIVAGANSNQVRLTGEGAPVGTPDYMSPEQVLGESVDGRADLYSLGIILYQMVTGTTPFQGESPMQIAAQHLQIPPPSPQWLRPDLPLAAEQAILKALAKRPSERYASGKELTNAFREALIGTGLLLGMSASSLLASATNARLAAMPKPAFNDMWQTGKGPVVAGAFDEPARNTPAEAALQFGRPTLALPAVGGSGLLKSTGLVPAVGKESTASMAAAGSSPRVGGGLLSKTGKFPGVGTGYVPAVATESASTATPTTSPQKAMTAQPAIVQFSPVLQNTTGTLTTPGQTRRNTIKLTESMKVVQVPVAGQPGRYLTGLLPASPPEAPKSEARSWPKVAPIVVALLLVIVGSVGAFTFMRTHPNHAPGNQATKSVRPVGTPNLQATAFAQATATVEANIILSDPLSTNTHNWLTTPPDVYAFKDGAYHITDRGNSGRATVLQGRTFTESLGYTLTIDEIAGDDTNASNSFGMILRFNQQMKSGKMVTTFYSFEVVNIKGGEYQFWKYDDSQASIWTELWHQPFGGEFHQGHGDQATNTAKLFAEGNNFTISINGKTVGKIQDGSLTGGTIGMIVNLNGTEVAFKNLLLTKN